MFDFQDAFISYGRLDSKAFTHRLWERLLQQGLKVWFDQNDIPLGVDFQNQINDGINSSHNFLFIISPHSVNSSYCNKEIEQALRYNKRIIPLMHVEQISQEVWQQRNPEGKQEDWEAFKSQGLHSSFPNMHPAIAKINWVYFREGIDDFDQSITALVDILHRHQTYVYRHTYFLARALDWQRHHKRSSYLLVRDERLEAQEWLKFHFDTEQPPCEPSDLHCEFICESTKNADNLMTQVFLCSAECDQAFTQQLAKTLMRQGFTIWVSKTDIQSGDDLELAANRGVEEADNIVFIMSSDSLTDSACQRALAYSRACNKRIIPLLIQPIPVEQLPPELRSLHFINCPKDQEIGKYEADTTKLIRLLQEDATYYEQHKILLAKALKWKRQRQNRSILLRGYDLKQYEAWLAGARTRSQHPPTALQEEFIAESQKQPPTDTLDVFIAYSRVDSDFVRKLNDGFQIQGKTTWFDQESIASGEEFQQEIYRGIERCNSVLFVLSPDSIHSPYCVDEVAYASQLNKRIVTLLYRDVRVVDLPPELAGIQWVDFRKHGGDFFTNFGDLTRALDADPEHLRNHTRLLLKAMEWEREGKDDGYLLRGKDLLASEQWLAQSTHKEPRPSDLQLQYLTASRTLPNRRVKPRTVALSSLAIAGLVCLARWFGATQWLELVTYDHLLRLRPNEAQDSRLLVIGVDEDSVEFLNNRYEPGKGTIPDEALDDLLRLLTPLQPQAIGLDFFRNFTAKPQLANRLAQTPNLITICKSSGISDRGRPVRGTTPPPEIPYERVGFANAVDDGGKFLRRQYVMQGEDPKYCNTIDSLSLVLARNYLATKGKSYTSPLDEAGDFAQSMAFGKTELSPLWGDGSGYRDRNDQLGGYQLLLNFRQHQGDPNQAIPMVSLKDVLNGKLTAQDVQGRIVLIGITDLTDVAADYWNTPFGEMPGVVLQAQMISQMLSAVLDGRSLIGWWSLQGETLWIVVWSLAGGFVGWWFLRPLPLAIVGASSLVTLYLICYLMLTQRSTWIPLVPPLIAFVASATMVQYLTERLHKA